MSGWVQNIFQMTYFDMPNNFSSMKYALKSVPGLADVWVPHGVEGGPRSLAPGSGSKMDTYHVDQNDKLKRLSTHVIVKAKMAGGSSDRCGFLVGEL